MLFTPWAKKEVTVLIATLLLPKEGQLTEFILACAIKNLYLGYTRMNAEIVKLELTLVSFPFEEYEVALAKRLS